MIVDVKKSSYGGRKRFILISSYKIPLKKKSVSLRTMTIANMWNTSKRPSRDEWKKISVYHIYMYIYIYILIHK
jgi:hypothetical protein